MSIDLGNAPVGTPPTVEQKTQIRTSIGAAEAAAVTASLALKANLASPALTGTPTAPTATGGTNTTQVATTAFVAGENASKAPLASPALTGTPTVPTAAPGTNTTQAASTAFVAAADALKANLASPALTGTPTAPTAAPGTNTTQLASTAFVAAADALKANLASPTFTGTPSAPTAGATTSSTQLATTAFARDLTYRRFASAAEAAGTPVSGTHLLRLDQARTFYLALNGNTTFDIYNLGTTDISDRGEFVLSFKFTSNVLRTVAFGDDWVASSDSDVIDNRFATYVINGVIAAGKVYYHIKEYFFIDESEFTNTVMMVGDIGEDSGPAFTAGMNYLVAQPMDYLLYAGDFNYPAGSAATIDDNSAPLNGLIAASKVLACHGNHDLDTIAQNWTNVSSPMAYAGTWRWNNTNVFASDFRTNAATSAGWSTVTGAAGVFPGFGEGAASSGTPTDNDSATYYFARVLNLASAPTAGQKVRIKMTIDDGALVYINGVLIYDFNIQYPVSHTSLAHVAVSATADNDWVFTERTVEHSILVDGACLQAGDNLIAVVIKQSDTTSSDVSWDMSIDIGTTTDVVPAFTDDIKYVNNYGQALRNKLPYLDNGMACYHRTVGSVADIFVLNDGINTAVKCSNPLSYKANGAMHNWFTTKLAASTRPFKIVMIHRCAVSTYNNVAYYDSDLDWPEFKDDNMLLVFGHTHQTCHYSHTSGQHIINASNSGGQTPRAVVALVGSATGYTVDFADGSTDYAVARLEIGLNFLRCTFEKTSDGSPMHSFIMSAP